MTSDENLINAIMDMHKVKEEYLDNKIDFITAKNKIRTISQLKGVEPKITMAVLRGMCG